MSGASHYFVTTILPTRAANEVVSALDFELPGLLLGKARGTLLRDGRWQRWLPPVSPAKVLMQAVVPSGRIDRFVSTAVSASKLDLQATGAIYATACEQVFFGSEFRAPPAVAGEPDGGPQAESDLNLISCIVEHRVSDRVAKAAIDAGGHGPIVYYAEGRGLRDRLGWLRITKEAEKEVLLVIADNGNVEEVFDAMAKAGGLHLPGRGFMYHAPIAKGLFNLPSRLSPHHYEANMQQIINAIDHLTGHSHWRDQVAFEVGDGRGVGIRMGHQRKELDDQTVLGLIARREDSERLLDFLLDVGMPGANVHYVRWSGSGDESDLQVDHEYAVVRCVTAASDAAKVFPRIAGEAGDAGFNDLCAMTHPVSRAVTYVPGDRDFRSRAA